MMAKEDYKDVPLDELLQLTLKEVAKAKEMFRILFEEPEMTEEEWEEIDNLTPEEEKVLRMRLGLAEPLKGSLDNNVYAPDQLEVLEAQKKYEDELILGWSPFEEGR